MALGGLLRRALKSPELMLALMGAGTGAIVNEDDRGVGALSGAAIGAGAGMGARGVRGLLSRVPVDPKALDAAAIQIRRAVPGITPQQSTQMPGNDFRDALRDYTKLILERQRKTDLTNAWRAGSGLALGGAGLAGAAFVGDKAVDQMSSDGHYKNFAKEALAGLGYDDDVYGVRAFQLEHDIPMSGEIDDKTLEKLILAHRSRQKNSEVDAIMAPSLKPEMP